MDIAGVTRGPHLCAIHPFLDYIGSGALIEDSLVH